MGIEYREIVPWGRSFEEYLMMFDLTEKDLEKNILGCGDGPASFNAEMKKSVFSCVSFDPIYIFSKKQIEHRIMETYATVLEKTSENQEKFVWENIKDVEELGKLRMGAMQKFLEDYESGKSEGRYIAGVLPNLPFKDNSFQLAICSHFLFLYSDNLSQEFHIDAIEEIFRVTKEARFFPILDMDGNKSKHLKPVCEHFKEKGYDVLVKKVDYEFQKNGNQLLIIKENSFKNKIRV